MALSNWDTIAWNEKGETCRGEMAFPNGVLVEIYKNWAYIHDPHAYRGKGEYYGKDTVLEFWEGQLNYRGIGLLAKRSRQNSIFLVATYSDKGIKMTLFGIGCYGYKEDKWIGVEPETIAQYMKWLSEVSKSSHLVFFDLPQFAKGLRYNQGDEYFAQVQKCETPATIPGEAQPTIMSQILRKAERKGERLIAKLKTKDFSYHGQPLPEGWIIHHLNGIKDDNRPENLFAMPAKNHHPWLLVHALRDRIKELESQNRHLMAQRRLL